MFWINASMDCFVRTSSTHQESWYELAFTNLPAMLAVERRAFMLFGYCENAHCEDCQNQLRISKAVDSHVIWPWQMQ